MHANAAGLEARLYGSQDGRRYSRFTFFLFPASVLAPS
jgi:hypothetical protein